jgi:hypothetical protein
MKRASKQWTRDERQRLALGLAGRIKCQVQKAAYGDNVRMAIYKMADTQLMLLTLKGVVLEANRTEIEKACGI